MNRMVYKPLFCLVYVHNGGKYIRKCIFHKHLEKDKGTVLSTHAQCAGVYESLYPINCKVPR